MLRRRFTPKAYRPLAVVLVLYGVLALVTTVVVGGLWIFLGVAVLAVSWWPPRTTRPGAARLAEGSKCCTADRRTWHAKTGAGEPGCPGFYVTRHPK